MSFESDHIEVIAQSIKQRFEAAQDAVKADVNKLFMLVLLVFSYLVFHQRSLFLTFASTLQLAMAIPIAICIYRYVLGITYLGSIHLSCMLIVVSIGSDDVLLFHDVWENARMIPALKNQPTLRLSYTFW